MPQPLTAPDYHQLAQMTRGVIVSLSLGVGDLEAGHYDAADRERLAGYLDKLAAALRGSSEPVVIILDAEMPER
ncbi:hypothetical protein [Saccharopolyspora spinosa]|uniref:Uncharacterized protein n=1 Tax=Saccharopolyspora spinosa TaxID=60894 RepID=A0A2N3Y6B0_SACSN|nr:hypothetical protein [Saccharopolyspora spinosa]PKW18464.1 hypothetical protein A8926_6550 [Saccharopolyspora spinosa]